ncbi:MAG: C-GCAxxG-C-C family protein [Candidatus Zixiibacteriota bacterium]
MNNKDFIEEKINLYFCTLDHNCAETVLEMLSEKFDFPLDKQVIYAAAAHNGLGQYRAQCGLITGAVMFIGIVAQSQGRDKDYINAITYGLAEIFDKSFGALDCRTLRPAGFKEDNPPNICKPLAIDALALIIDYIENSDLF